MGAMGFDGGRNVGGAQISTLSTWAEGELPPHQGRETLEVGQEGKEGRFVHSEFELPGSWPAEPTRRRGICIASLGKKS